MSEQIQQLEDTLDDEQQAAHEGLSRYDRVKLARNQDRPFTLDFVNASMCSIPTTFPAPSSHPTSSAKHAERYPVPLPTSKTFFPRATTPARSKSSKHAACACGALMVAR